MFFFLKIGFSIKKHHKRFIKKAKRFEAPLHRPSVAELRKKKMPWIHKQAPGFLRGQRGAFFSESERLGVEVGIFWEWFGAKIVGLGVSSGFELLFLKGFGLFMWDFPRVPLDRALGTWTTRGAEPSPSCSAGKRRRSPAH